MLKVRKGVRHGDHCFAALLVVQGEPPALLQSVFEVIQAIGQSSLRLLQCHCGRGHGEVA
jgi:hypothetical protein